MNSQNNHVIFQPGRLSIACDCGCGVWPLETHVLGLKCYTSACCPVCGPKEARP